jgi:recombination protein RecT
MNPNQPNTATAQQQPAAQKNPGQIKLQVLHKDMHEAAFAAAYDATLPTTMKRFMPLDRAINILIRACQKNPRLVDCEPRTLKQCLLDSAALGLELGGPLHHAHAVPYWITKKNHYEAQLQIGFQGFLELARRTGEINGAPIVQWVYESDVFTVNFGDGHNPVTHHPYLNGPRGAPKLVYCLIWFKSGGYHFDFMTHNDVEKHRDLYAKRDKKGNLPDTWLDHFDEMGRKTIIRRAAKHWPLSSELAQAMEVDEATERGESVALVDFGGGNGDDDQSGDKQPRAATLLNKIQGGKSQEQPKPEEPPPVAVDNETGEVIDAEFTVEPPPVDQQDLPPPPMDEPKDRGIHVQDQSASKTVPKKSKRNDPITPAQIVEIDRLSAERGLTAAIVQSQVILEVRDPCLVRDLTAAEADGLMKRLLAFPVK